MRLAIRLKRITCVRENNESSASEEPYVLLTAVRLQQLAVGPAIHNLRVSLYGVFENFDAGESVELGDPPFWGLNGTPDELASLDDTIFVVTLMENDNGDPSAYRQLVEAAAAASLGATIGENNRAVRAQLLRKSIADALDGINLPIPFALDDDHIASELLQLDSSHLVRFGSAEKVLHIVNAEGNYELTFQVTGSPFPVAFNPQDRWVVTMGSRVFVIVKDGAVFAHELGNTIGAPFQLAGARVGFNPQDKWVVTMGNRILVIVKDGGVFGHDISGTTIGPAFRLSGPPVAFNPQDKWVVTMGNRILVIVNDGSVFGHDITGTTIGPAFRLSGPRVAFNKEDRWVVTMGNRIVVIVNNGAVFAHDLAGTTIGNASRLAGPPVAFNPQDKWVVTIGNRVFVIVDNGSVFAHDFVGNTIGPGFQLSS